MIRSGGLERESLGGVELDDDDGAIGDGVGKVGDVEVHCRGLRFLPSELDLTFNIIIKWLRDEKNNNNNRGREKDVEERLNKNWGAITFVPLKNYWLFYLCFIESQY